MTKWLSTDGQCCRRIWKAYVATAQCAGSRTEDFSSLRPCGLEIRREARSKRVVILHFGVLHQLALVLSNPFP
ncbi:hypothetical protein VULLAG_LOCUS7675 [Vulpes lagopus]